MDEDAVRQLMGKMIVCDYLLANNDRHRRNFGFIRNIHTLEIRPAPLFDSGNCLWYNKTAAEIKRADWSHLSKPFCYNPEQQLSLAERLDWFDPSGLHGFADEAMQILANSTFASDPARFNYIKQGLEAKIASTSAVLSVLRYK